MDKNKMFLAILPFLTFVLISQTTFADSASQAQGIGNWTVSTYYPTNISAQSCSVSNSYIYCVGGFNGTNVINATYFAHMTSSGVGNWTQTTSYPIPVENVACTTYQNYIYCVGGVNLENGDFGVLILNETFYAPISASGIGNWNRTSLYPFPISGESCTTYEGNIYCVGGATESSYTRSVYTSGLSAKGLGPWSATKSYPINVTLASCVVNSSYIYCLGGDGLNTLNYLGNSYYAKLTDIGISQWLPTTRYPINTSSQSCVASNNYIYCNGGYAFNTAANYTQYLPSTYFAPLNSSGIGQWSEAKSYYYPLAEASCDSYNNNIYCIGGEYSGVFTNLTMIATIINPNIPTSTAVSGPTTIAQVSNENSSQPPVTTVNTQQQPSPNQGNGLVYLILLFLVILILLILLAFYLFNKGKPSNKKQSNSRI